MPNSPIFFQAAREWLKCALHAHFTESDGDLPPRALAQAYDAAGCDVLASTDHRRLTRLRSSAFLLTTRGSELFRPERARALEADELGFAYAYSFICTNLDWEVTEIEAWFKMRALVEEKIKDGSSPALRHLPSGFVAVNRTSMWPGFLALNISTWVQSLCGLDAGRHGRGHRKRLRRELIAVPARVLHHAHCLVLRVAPEHRDGVIGDAWVTLGAIASFAGP